MASGPLLAHVLNSIVATLCLTIRFQCDTLLLHSAELSKVRVTGASLEQPRFALRAHFERWSSVETFCSLSSTTTVVTGYTLALVASLHAPVT